MSNRAEESVAHVLVLSHSLSPLSKQIISPWKAEDIKEYIPSLSIWYWAWGFVPNTCFSNSQQPQSVYHLHLHHLEESWAASSL